MKKEIKHSVLFLPTTSLVARNNLSTSCWISQEMSYYMNFSRNFLLHEFLKQIFFYCVLQILNLILTTVLLHRNYCPVSYMRRLRLKKWKEQSKVHTANRWGNHDFKYDLLVWKACVHCYHSIPPLQCQYSDGEHFTQNILNTCIGGL